MATRSTRAPSAQLASSPWPAGVLEMLRCSSGLHASSMRQPARTSLCESIPMTAILGSFPLGFCCWQNGPVVRTHALGCLPRRSRFYQATSPSRHTGGETLN